MPLINGIVTVGADGAGLVLYTTDGGESFDSSSDVGETDADDAAVDGCDGGACGGFGDAAFYDVPDDG